MYVWLFLPFISELLKIGIKHQWKSYQVCFGGGHGLFGYILAALLHAVLGSAIPGGWVEDESTEFRSEYQPFCIPPHFCYCRQMSSWVVEHQAQNGCLDLRCRAFPLDIDRWEVSGADVKDPWHGVLETVWLFSDEAQQVDACEDRKIVR